MSASGDLGSQAGGSARTGRREWLFLGLVLVVMGAGWGVTQPLAKIAVSDGYRHVGIVFWQFVLSGAILATICAVRRTGLPLTRRALGFYLLIAFLGTLLPNAASYEAARHLPAGWLSILIATVPLFAFPIALALGIDRFHWARLLGLCLGLAGVSVLAHPAAGTAGLALAWVAVALLAPFFYAVEGNTVARWGTGGTDPVQLLLGASIVGALIAAPAALATGTWIDPRPPWGMPDAAIAISSTVHALVYATYVWLVARAGAVFAAQVSYLVTGFGVLWSMAILGESYDGGFWLAMALMFAGLFLVQPRSAAP